MPKAKHQVDVLSPTSGYITATHCRDFGIALAILEGGRSQKEDKIDFGVGLEFHRRIGDHVNAGEKLVTIQYNSRARLAEAREMIQNGFVFGDDKPSVPPLIRRVIGG